MELREFEGQTFGPNSWHVAPDSVRDFVALTGDDPRLWIGHAPPGFAAAALFAVAPELLGRLADRSVVHGEQSFRWARPIEVNGVYEVSGSVKRVRERSGVHFVTFEMVAGDGSGVVVEGESLFLVTGDAPMAGENEERAEPSHSDRGNPAPDQVSASRADLVRYASATRDWNPVHWDHDAGVLAGFPGVVVHGLLQAGWALGSVNTHNGGDRPFESARFRFRNPMLPGCPAAVASESSDSSIEVTISDDAAVYLRASIVVANE